MLRAAHGEGEKRLVGLFGLLDDLEGDAGGVLGRAVPADSVATSQRAVSASM
jgi:hypothetical protein